MSLPEISPVGIAARVEGDQRALRTPVEKSGILRVLALVSGVVGTRPSQRFRIEQWAPGLSARGVKIEFEAFMSPELQAALYQPGKYGKKTSLIGEALLRRAKCLRHLKEFDLVYVERETALLGPALFERWISSKGVPYVFDFDDAIFLPNSSEANRAFALLKFPGKTATACRLAAHVMAGNDYLAEYARRFNRRVTVVPTTIDTEKYRPPEPRWEIAKPQLVWTGSPTTARYLESLAGALLHLRKRHDFTLRVIGAPRPFLPGIDVEVLPWQSATEATNLQGAWAGLMPVPDDAWARGKCACKALQYMGVGIPAVCSPVGMNDELIRDGENGLLASSEDDWVEKLTLLLNSRELRQRLGRAGRQTVEAWYSAEVQAPRVCEIFRSAVPISTGVSQSSGEMESSEAAFRKGTS